jgi:CheY-like chemotaxis protein
VVAAPIEETHRKLRILVVDDNIDQVRALAWLVKDCGHHADYAINGIVALELAQRTKPDVLLLDVFLPDTTGFELVRQLRLNPEMKDVHVIGITGQHVERSEALANGFDQLLMKPVEFRHVEAALSRVK